MARTETPTPPIPRAKFYPETTRELLLDEIAESFLDVVTDEEVLIGPELVNSAFQSYLETGGADPDKDFKYSIFEERIVTLRKSGEAHIGQIVSDIDEAREVLLASARMSVSQTNQLPKFTRSLQRRAYQLWTEPNPSTRP